MPFKDPEKRKTYNREYYKTPRGRAKAMASALKRTDEKYNSGECTIDEQWIMDNIFTQPCYYCGETDWRVLGCDRMDNNLPHTPENIVCCCKQCNKKRGNIPFNVFIERLRSGEILLKKNRPDCSKPVIALNDAGEVVYEFPSTAEAGRNGFDRSAVCKCCNGCYLREGNHKYKGLWWYWA